MFGFRFLNDRTLIQLIKTANEEALTLLYARTYKKVYRYVLSQKGRIKDAEEVLAESLLTAWQHVVRQKGVQSFALAPYVLAIARNRWNKRDRKRGKKKNAPVVAEENAAQLTMKEWWGNLSETDKKLLGYTYFDGFSAREIADLTGMHSQDTVRQRKSELMRELSDKMRREF